jgi:hypothetical protein
LALKGLDFPIAALSLPNADREIVVA